MTNLLLHAWPFIGVPVLGCIVTGLMRRKFGKFEAYVLLMFAVSLAVTFYGLYLDYIPEGSCKVFGERCVTSQEAAEVAMSGGAMSGYYTAKGIGLFILGSLMYIASFGVYLIGLIASIGFIFRKKEKTPHAA